MTEALSRQLDTSTLLSVDHVNALTAQARVLAESTLTPKHLGGDNPRQAVANCLMLLDLGVRMGRPFLELARASYVVHGKLGFSAEFFLASAQRMGLFKGAPRYKTEELGEPFALGNKALPNIAVTATVTDAETGEEVSTTVAMTTVMAEGWHTRSGSKYMTIPEVMLRKRAITWLIRDHYPAALFGQPEVGELIDHAAEEAREVQAEAASAVDRLMGRAVEQPEAVEVEEVETGPPVTARTMNGILDYLNSDDHDGPAALQFMLDAWKVRRTEDLTEEQGSELLDRFASGDFNA